MRASVLYPQQQHNLTSIASRKSVKLLRCCVYICVLSAAFVLIVGAYRHYTPYFEGPDSGAHFQYIAFLNEHGRLPELTPESAALSHQLVQQPPLYYALSALLIPNAGNQLALSYNRPNPYFTKGMSSRAGVTSPLVDVYALRPIQTARSVSTFAGLLTLICTFMLARRLFPKEPAFAFCATAITVLNPQFIFGSAVITNDILAAGSATLALLVGTVVAQRTVNPHVDDSLRRSALMWLGVGICAGIAALAKYSCLLLLVPLSLLLFWGSYGQSWKSRLMNGAAFFLGWLIIAGGWYIPNLLRYGTPVPTEQILALLPGLARSAPLPLSSLWDVVPRLQVTYWGMFGYGVMAPHWYYRVTNLFVLVGLVGLGVHVAMSFWSSKPWLNFPFRKATILMLLSWAIVVILSLSFWARMVFAGDQGRLLFPAAAAIGILLTLGWRRLLPRKWRPWLLAMLALAIMVIAALQIRTLQLGYQLPIPVEQPLAVARDFNAKFEAGMELVGVDYPDGAALDSRGAMPVTLYLRASGQIDDFYTLFLHLAAADDQILYQFDGVPAQGRHPTAQWIPGQLFSETLYVSAGEIEENGLATLSMGFYNVQEPNSRQKIVGQDGQLGADRVVLGKVRLHVASPSPPLASQQGAVAAWQDEIALSAFQLQFSEDGRSAEIDITWESLAVLHEDYTIFLQMIGSEGNLLAQSDQYPQSGQFPTSTWRIGDISEERYKLTSESTVPSQIIVGLYDNQLNRLQLTSPPLPNGGQGVTDYFVLWTNDQE